MKNIKVFFIRKFSVLEVKFSIYLNRHVYVMFSLLPVTYCFFFFFSFNTDKTRSCVSLRVLISSSDCFSFKPFCFF